MGVVWIRGSKTNKKILEDLESVIIQSLKNRGYSVERVKIRNEEFEYRCKTKNKQVRVLTFNLKLANRSFVIQWLINLVFKEKEKLFMGSKFASELGDEDPVYSFDVVPYSKKSYISQRFDHFVEFDDISTKSSFVDEKFMVKSQTHAYVDHLVENEQFVGLLKKSEPYIEHLSLSRSKEDTDPHYSVTFHFNGKQDNPIKEFVNLYFLGMKLHLENNGKVKKLIAKGRSGKGFSGKHGTSSDFKRRMKKKQSKGKRPQR